MALGIDDVAAGRYLLLTTFDADGAPKPTPVAFVAEGDELLVATSANSWKVKRIAGTPRVTVAACTRRGTVVGETMDATAVIIRDPASVERIRTLVAERYGWPARLMGAWLDRRREPRAGISVTLGAPEPG